ncbi:MAG: Holliday junction branch migration protein RuvA [Firmicutes bacterium]|nr:Holliday junction branch migration protein RuvA [Bacillota bacterium]
MIERLRGPVVGRRPGAAVVDVGGLGLEVQLTARAEARLPTRGEATLLTRFVVREDGVALYGFADEAEREGFDRLLGVAGVGPRLALATVSTLAPDRLRRALAGGDAAALTAVPGVGRKIAQRMILDLKEWAAEAVPGEGGEGQPAAPAGGAAADGPDAAFAVQALVALGYGPAEARQAVREALTQGAGEAGELVRASLARLGRAPVRAWDEGSAG